MLVPGSNVWQTIFFNTDIVSVTVDAQKRGAVGDDSFITALFSARQTRLVVVNSISVQMIH